MYWSQKEVEVEVVLLLQVWPQSCIQTSNKAKVISSRKSSHYWSSRSIYYCTCDVGPAFKPQTRQLLQASFSANCSRPASDTALPSRWTSAWLDRDLQNMRGTRSLLFALRVWTEELISIFQGVRPLPYLGQDPFSKIGFEISLKIQACQENPGVTQRTWTGSYQPPWPWWHWQHLVSYKSWYFHNHWTIFLWILA